MAFIGPLLGAGVSAFSALSNRGAAQDANNINWMNLFETRRRNKAEETMAKSSRKDAYGNVMKFTPGVGWEIDTTPMTQAILGSQQNEELRQLREDAPRNRLAAVRKDSRSRLGDEEFTKQFNEFRFRPRQTEEGSIGDATTSLLNARKKGNDEASALLARQLMRTGNSSQLASVYKAANDSYAGSLEDAILRGKELGRKNYRSNEAAELANRTGELGFLKGVADDSGHSNVGMPGGAYNAGLSGRADQAQAALMQAMARGTSNIQNASSNLASSTGRTGLDLSGVASAFGNMDLSGEKPISENEQLRNALLRQKLGMGGGAVQSDPSYAASNDPWAGLRNVGENLYFG